MYFMLSLYKFYLKKQNSDDRTTMTGRDEGMPEGSCSVCQTALGIMAQVSQGHALRESN